MLFFILFLPYFSGFTAFFCVGSLSPEGADDSFFLCKELIPDIWTALPVFIRRRKAIMSMTLTSRRSTRTFLPK